jgi:hypothetical protein
MYMSESTLLAHFCEDIVEREKDTECMLQSAFLQEAIHNLVSLSLSRDLYVLYPGSVSSSLNV